jgi:hypothetical protein
MRAMRSARLLVATLAVAALAASFAPPDGLANLGARALGRGSLEDVTVEVLAELPWLLRGLALLALAWLALRPALASAPPAAPEPGGPRAGRLALAAIVAGGLVLAALVRAFVLREGLISGDEWNNEFIARLFAQGRLWDRPPPHPEFFRFTYFVTLPDRTFSIFPPLWPAILGLGHALGIGGWIHLAVAGGAAWLVGRWHAPRRARTGRIAAVLLVLSPMFVFSAASSFASPTVLLLLVAALACLRRGLEPGARTTVWFLAAGLLWGLGFAAHYPTAVGGGLPPLAWAVWKAGRARGSAAPALAVAVAALGPLAALGAYHHALHGGPPWLLPAALYEESMLRPELGLALVAKGVAYTALHAVRLLGWTFPLLPLLALPGLAAALGRGPRAAEERLLGLAVVGIVVLYAAYPSAGGPQYGPRYWFGLLGPLALLAAPTVERLARPHRGRAFLAVLVAASVSLFVVRARIEGARAAVVNAPFRLAEAARLEHAIVVMQNVNRADRARNAPGWSAPVLFVPDLGAEREGELRARFPDRAFHTYRRGPGGPELRPGLPSAAR